MVSIRSIAATVLIFAVAATTADAQLLKKLKKATKKALDVAEEVDRYTFSEDEEIEQGYTEEWEWSLSIPTSRCTSSARPGGPIPDPVPDLTEICRRKGKLWVP